MMNNTEWKNFRSNDPQRGQQQHQDRMETTTTTNNSAAPITANNSQPFPVGNSSKNSNDLKKSNHNNNNNKKEHHHHHHRSALATSSQFHKQQMQLAARRAAHVQSESQHSRMADSDLEVLSNINHSNSNSSNSNDQNFPVDYHKYSSCWDQVIDMIQQFRYHCGVLVNDNRVQLFIVALIAINAIMMGIGTFDFVTENPKVDAAFEMVDKIFLIIFTVELGMQFAFYGWRLLSDGWLVFDTMIIVLSWAFAQVQIIRAFRIFRAFRLITRIKVLKNLVLALFGVVPRMFAIALLLTLVSYIFAVMFTQLFKDLYEDELTYEDYFGRMDKTLFTLFQLMTLDSWSDIARQVMEVYSWAWLPFISFVIITGFVVVNLIIAVICDAIAALREDEKAKLHGTYEGSENDGSGESESEEDKEDSADPVVQEEILREHLNALEDQVEELSRMQEESLMALAQLTAQLQAHGGAETSLS